MISKQKMDVTERADDILMPDDLEPNHKNGADAPAWEEVRAGRYRPRRIKGSCRGRELG